MTSDHIDPVRLEVLWTNLQGITEEMGTHFQQSAFSDVIKYSNDLSTALFTWDGRLIAQGQYSPGILMGTAPAMREILDEYVPFEEWDPGDVVLTNNPHIGSGHLPDFFMFAPIFDDDDLVGFAASVGHQTDVGGSAPGSFSVYTTDIYQEGLQLPPVKLYEGGELNEPLFETILENSRVEEQMHGDLRAQSSALTMGEQQYLDLVERFGFEEFKQYVEHMFERSEEGMRKAIDDVDDGSYTFRQSVDGFEEPLEICVEVEVDGGELTVDFAGTSDQHTYAINSPFNYTAAYTYLSIIGTLQPDVPQTHGSDLPINIIAPEGSLVNPRDRAPVASRSILSERVLTTVNGALHEALPGRIAAGGSEQFWEAMKFTGSEGIDQQVLSEGYYGGAGAHVDRDGFPAVSSGPNVKNMPIEVIESVYPLQMNQYQLAPDTAGAGRYRGGSGTVREYEFLDAADVQLVGEGSKFPPYGLEGGESGHPVRCVLISDGEEREISDKENIAAEAGDVLRVYTSGGGGYGDPADRDEEAVREDIEDGIISEQFAREHYGIED